MRAQIRGRFDAVRDIDIEAFLCGELDEPARAALERASQGDVELARYLDERREAQQAFVREHPLTFAPSALTRRRRDGAALWGAALAAVVLLGLLTPELARETRPGAHVPGGPDTVRIKGHVLPAELYVKRGRDVFRYRNGVGLRPEDQVRIAVDCPRAGYLSVFGRDARGAITVYYDRLATEAGRYTVPDSLILDDAPGDEQWFVVHAREPLPATHYVEQLLAGRALDAPHARLELHKESP